MNVTPKQIEYLARAIVNRLEDRGLVEFTDAEAGIEVVVKTLTENFRLADEILQQARDRARADGRNPSEEELETEARRIALTRNFVL